MWSGWRSTQSPTSCSPRFDSAIPVPVLGDVHLRPSAAARLLGESSLSVGLARTLIVVLPLAVTALAGWRRPARRGDLAALSGAVLIVACLVQVQVIRDLPLARGPRARLRNRVDRDGPGDTWVPQGFGGPAGGA